MQILFQIQIEPLAYIGEGAELLTPDNNADRNYYASSILARFDLYLKRYFHLIEK